MATSMVDTFEHDIAEEIRHKEASIADIATAVGDIGNDDTKTPKHNLTLIIIVSILSFCGLIGAGLLVYSYYSGAMSPVTVTNTPSSEIKKVGAGASLKTLSPAMDQSIGSFVTNVQKSKLGYSMNITSYPPVFAYMLKNENAFGEELALALGNSHTVKKSEEPKQIQATTTTKETTASTTIPVPKTSTSTQATTTTETEETKLPETYIFSDITISNQNMRIATSAYGTVVYAFIGTQRLVISTSTEGILALRSSVLQK